MKYILNIALVFFLVLSACQPGGNNGGTLPEGPAERKALLTEKRQQLTVLEKEIAQLEDLLGEDPARRANEKPRLVTTEVVTKSTFRRFTEIQGNVAPVQMNTISSETGGRLLRVLVKEGDQVKAGQLLASVDMEPLQKQMQEIESAHGLAKDVYERQKRLWDQKIGSELQFLQAKNNLDRLDKSMESLRSQLRKANIYAPISGVIEELVYEQGDVAPPGMPIMHLINTSQLKISADAPERYVGTVKSGDKVRIRIPVLNMEQEAKVTLVGKVVHPSNRTFKLETTVNNSKGLLKPNLLALVDIEDYNEPESIVISVDLVQQEVGGKSFVYIKEEDPLGFRAKKVYVTVGESYANTIVIKEGLNVGDELIVRGARGMGENDLLNIQNETND